MKTRLSLILIILLALLFSASCQQADTCKKDKLDGNWSEIVDNDSCTEEQKGEAYLALGGFDSFNLLNDPDNANFIAILGLTKGNWASKYGYFHRAVNTVKPVTESTESDFKKTIYFFASFLRLYTYVIGNLDGDPIDGDVESSEISDFTGVGVAPGGGDDGTLLTTTTKFQFKSGGSYYIVDSTGPTYYTDSNADGSEKNETTLSVAQQAAVANPSGWSEVNQVMHMESLSDPLQSTGGSVDVTTITSFSGNLLTYMTDVDQALAAIGIDESADARKAIDDFRTDLDNGAECSTLNSNPALRLVEMIVSNSQYEAVTNYQNVNLFSVAELQGLGEESTLTETDPFGSGLVPGIKMLFKPVSGNYVPYWQAAHSDVADALASLSNFSPIEVKKLDGKIAFSEIICLSETSDP
jgi:hypothetical protein